MREICIKQSESNNHRRKNLTIVEMIRQDGMVARAEKKFSYYVYESPNQNPSQIEHIAEMQASATQPKKDRHVSIKKLFDNKSGTGQMAYRVIGSFFVVQNLHIFTVVFMHSIKFDMISRKAA